jgi:hypothetical protein
MLHVKFWPVLVCFACSLLLYNSHNTMQPSTRDVPRHVLLQRSLQPLLLLLLLNGHCFVVCASQAVN